MSIFNLPDLGEGLPDAEVIKWLVDVGEHVQLDQPLVEMETAKAIVEVPSPQQGQVLERHGNPGDIIKTGSPLVTFKEATSATISHNTTRQTEHHNRIFYLPDLGEGLQEAEIVEWKIQLGDFITTDQVIASMETAKAVVDLPSPFSGTVIKLYGHAGDLIKTGSALLEISYENNTHLTSTEETTSGGVVGDLQSSNGILTENRTFNDGTNATPAVRALARKLGIELHKVTPNPASGSITLADLHTYKQNTLRHNQAQAQDFPTKKIGPAARNLANKLDVNILSITGTGPKGSITNDDIERAAKLKTAPTNNAFTQDEQFNTIKAAPKVRATAKQLKIDLHTIKPSGHLGNITLQDLFNHKQQSTTPQTHTISELNLEGLNVETSLIRGASRAMFTAMSHARDRVMNTSIFDDANVSDWTTKQDITMRFVRAITHACKIEPKLNAWLDEARQSIVLHNNVNLGIAVDSDKGLYVPVIKCSDIKSIAEIRNELNNHREAIKTRTIKPEHLHGGSITLSNFGVITGRYATPIVSPPQVAIIGTGCFYNALALSDENNVISQRYIPLSLSFDHRAVTGGEAARFLKALIQDLQKSD